MAADTTIPYSVAQQVGKNLAEAVGKFAEAKDEIDRVLVVLNAMTGGGVTPANLEAAAASPLFQTPLGTGAALYTAVNNMATNMALVVIKDIDKGV